MEGSQYLEPLAVFPVASATSNTIDPQMEAFASTSNSEIVYACDEFGNQIALGLIINEDYSLENMKRQNVLEPEVDGIANNSWVAAVEECSTADVLNEDTGPAPSSIRKYKVNKPAKRQKQIATTAKEQKRTLKDIQNEIFVKKRNRTKAMKTVAKLSRNQKKICAEKVTRKDRK